ncbi:MAG TPA: hypothetical protein VFE13_12060 [Caulobacteraceae bacterium]|jgi:hypothetical protein|nr:hypothetical protein [Caulobacteraceae bacterium]
MLAASTERVRLALACALALAPALALGAPRSATTHGFSNVRLIAAARASPLKLIDALETYCDGDMPVATWLARLTGAQVRSVAWTAGKCALVNDLNPLDAGGSYCVQARLTLKHPKNRRDQPEVEIYLEHPKGGRAGAAYAFRASFDGVDGPDYIRFRKDFDAAWRERFPATLARCSDG